MVLVPVPAMISDGAKCGTAKPFQKPARSLTEGTPEFSVRQLAQRRSAFLSSRGAAHYSVAVCVAGTCSEQRRRVLWGRAGRVLDRVEWFLLVQYWLPLTNVG